MNGKLRFRSGGMASNHPRLGDLGGAAIEVEVLHVHTRRDLLAGEHCIAANRRQPLIYNFRAITCQMRDTHLSH